MPVVAGLPDMGVDTLDQIVRRDARIDHDVAVCRPRPARAVLLEKDVVRPDARERRHHGAVSGVMVVLPHGLKLIAGAQPQGLVVLFVGSRRRQPCVAVGHGGDARHGFGKHGIIARPEVGGGSGLFRPDGDFKPELPVRNNGVRLGEHAMHHPVDHRAFNGRAPGDGQAPGRRRPREEHHALGMGGGLPLQLDAPGVHVQIAPGREFQEHVGQGITDEEPDQPQGRGGHDGGNEPPERGPRRVIRNLRTFRRVDGVPLRFHGGFRGRYARFLQHRLEKLIGFLRHAYSSKVMDSGP